MKNVTEIYAVQDVSCLTAAKFFYHFAAPVSHEVIGSFQDCTVVSREFSKIVRAAKDLVSIKRDGEFRADFVIGATRAVVYFDGDVRTVPRTVIDGFDRRLRAVGYGRVRHSVGSRPRCDRCPAGVLKGCITAHVPRGVRAT